MGKKIVVLSFLAGRVVGDSHVDDACLGKGTHKQRQDSLERILANVHDRMHGHDRMDTFGAHNDRIVDSSARTGDGARAEDNDARDDDVDMDDVAAADALQRQKMKKQPKLTRKLVLARVTESRCCRSRCSCKWWIELNGDGLGPEASASASRWAEVRESESICRNMSMHAKVEERAKGWSSGRRRSLCRLGASVSFLCWRVV